MGRISYIVIALLLSAEAHAATVVIGDARFRNLSTAMQSKFNAMLPAGARGYDGFDGAEGPTGPPGPKGDTGDAATVTRAAVTSVLDDPDDTPISLQPASTGQVPLQVFRSYSGSVRNYVDSWGYQHFKDANGYVLTKILTDGTIIMYDKSGIERVKLDNLGRVTLKDSFDKQRVFFNASTGTVRTYRSNGSTVAFEVYSSGRTFPAATGGTGTPGGSTQQIQYNNGGTFGGFGKYSSGCLIL